MEEFFLVLGREFDSIKELKSHMVTLLTLWDTEIIKTCCYFASTVGITMEEESTNGVLIYCEYMLFFLKL